MLKKLILALSAMTLVACSGIERTPDEQAIQYALVNDVMVRKMSDECSKVSVVAKQAAWRGYRSWWKRNASLVEAADFGLSYNLVTLTDNRLETGARYAMGLTFDIVADAEQRVAKMLESGDREATCVDVMGEYQDGSKDLRENEEMYGYLVKIQQRASNEANDHYLKIAKIESKRGEKYSRSAYVVERLVKRNGCVSPKVRTLKTDGPNEVLEATCADSSFMLVRCEWRNCKIQN